MNTLTPFWYAPPTAAAAYTEARLDAADRTRLTRGLPARRRADWKASRALKAHVGPATGRRCLGHRHGHVVLADAPADCLVGVDIEQILPRDVQAIWNVCGTSAEQAAAAQLPDADALLYFYLAWTVKEAAIKAFDLGFPSGLKASSLLRVHGQWHLRLPERLPFRLLVAQPAPELIASCLLVAPPGQALSAIVPHDWRGSDHAHWPVLIDLYQDGTLGNEMANILGKTRE